MKARHEPTIRPARHGELPALVAIDDAASALIASEGLTFDLGPEHPYVQAEIARWGRAIESGLAFVAVDHADAPLGFVVLGWVDGAPYLDQLSTHPRAMRRGIGSALLRRAIDWSAPRGVLWLTTYAGIPWNAPFYARHGFSLVAEDEHGPELRRILETQRATLPAPERRVAMARRRAPGNVPRR